MADEDDVELAVAVEVCDDGLGRDVGGESDGGGEGSIAVAEHNSGESVGAELWVGAAAEGDVREAVVVEVGDDDGGCASGAGVEAGAGGGEGDALGVCAEGAVGDGAEGDGAGGSAGGEDESVRDAVVVEVGDEDGECALCGGEAGGGEEGDDGKRDAACSAEGRRGAGGAGLGVGASLHGRRDLGVLRWSTKAGGGADGDGRGAAGDGLESGLAVVGAAGSEGNGIDGDGSDGGV